MTDELEPIVDTDDPAGLLPAGNPLTIDAAERAKRLRTEKSRTIEGMKNKWQQEDREKLQAAREVAAPPIIAEPRCRVCQSEYRAWIEDKLMQGASYESIAQRVPNVDGKKVERRSISNHFKQHMGYENAIVRGVLEEHADLLNQNFEEGVRGAFTTLGAIEVLIRKAYEDALAGITTVEPRDLIQLIKLLQEMEGSSSTKMVEEAKTSISLFMSAIQNVLSDRFDRDEAEAIKVSIRDEIRRLREQDSIDAQIEDALRLSSGSPDIDD